MPVSGRRSQGDEEAESGSSSKPWRPPADSMVISRAVFGTPRFREGSLADTRRGKWEIGK
jgi:hypothetical protein